MYWQSRNRDTDVENRLRFVDKLNREQNVGRMNWEIGIEIDTLLCIKKITSGSLPNNTENYCSTQRSSHLIIVLW